MKKRFLFTLLASWLASILPAGGPEGADDALVQLSYAHSGMCWGERMEIQAKDGGAVFMLDDKNAVPEEYTREVPADVLAAFGTLAKTHDIRSWKGFKQSEHVLDVLDGDSFSLSATWASGESLYIRAYMDTPKGYNEFRKDLLELCGETARRFPPLNGRKADTKGR